jgi:hypothetical protein
MPLDVRFDESRKLLYITVSGAWPTLSEIIEERSRLILAGYLRPGVVELVDARGVSRNLPNLSQMQGILKAIGNLPHKRAVLVNSNVAFAAGRVAEALHPKGLKVFRDEDAALAWLFEGEPPEGPLKFDRSDSGRIAVVKNR